MEFKVYKCVFCHLFLPFFPLSGEISEESKAATIEMLTALQSRKDALQESLKKKTDELKALCLKEAVIIHFKILLYVKLCLIIRCLVHIKRIEIISLIILQI